MNKDLIDLIKSLNNGKVYGLHSKLAKLFNISNVSVRSWFNGTSKPSDENVKKLAKLSGKREEDIKKIFEINYQSNNSSNVNSFNSLEEQIKLKDKEIELLNKEIELLKKEMLLKNKR